MTEWKELTEEEASAAIQEAAEEVDSYSVVKYPLHFVQVISDKLKEKNASPTGKQSLQVQAADTIDAQRRLLEQARDAQQAIVDHNCFERWVPEQPDDDWRPKSQVLFDSIDAITEHLKAYP